MLVFWGLDFALLICLGRILISIKNNSEHQCFFHHWSDKYKSEGICHHSCLYELINHTEINRLLEHPHPKSLGLCYRPHGQVREESDPCKA